MAMEMFTPSSAATAGNLVNDVDPTTVLAGVFTEDEDEAQIREKYLLVEYIKKILNGVCGSFARLSELNRDKQLDEVRKLYAQFEQLKVDIARREAYFSTYLQRLELQINAVHELSTFLQESSKTQNYAEAFDAQIPDMQWLDAVLHKFNRAQDPNWLLIKSKVVHWNRIAELSRMTPRTLAQPHYGDDFTLSGIQDLGMPNSNLPPIYPTANGENQTTMGDNTSTMISNSNLSAHDNALAQEPDQDEIAIPTNALSQPDLSNDTNNSMNCSNFMEETTETWGTEARIQSDPLAVLPTSQEASLQSVSTPNLQPILTHYLESPSQTTEDQSTSSEYHLTQQNPASNSFDQVQVTTSSPTANNTGSVLNTFTSSADGNNTTGYENTIVINSETQCLPVPPFLGANCDETSFLPPAPKRSKSSLPVTQIPETVCSFGGIKLKPGLIAKMASKGYVEPLPQQSQGIAHILEGRDVILNFSKGKTSTALIGVLQSISESVTTPQAIILYPSAKDAQKAHMLCSEMSSMMNIKTVLLISEETLGHHDIASNNFAQVVFTTPWILQKVQLLDPLLFNTAKFLVLDGANKLQEINSFRSVILKIVPELNGDTRILILAHGMSARLSNLMKKILRRPVEVNDKGVFTHSELVMENSVVGTQSPASSSSALSDSDTSRDGFLVGNRGESSVSIGLSDTPESDSFVENVNKIEVSDSETIFTVSEPASTSSSSDSNDMESTDSDSASRGTTVRHVVPAQVICSNSNQLVEHYYIESDCDEEKLECLKATEQRMIDEQAIIVCNKSTKAVWLFQKLNAMNLECYLVLDEHFQLKAELISRFRTGRIRVLILTHDTLSRSGNMLKRVPFLFNYDFPLDALMYCERIGHTGCGDNSTPGGGTEINIFSFLTKSDLEIVRTLRSTHEIHLKNFQYEGSS